MNNKLSKAEKDILESYENDEWVSVSKMNIRWFGYLEELGCSMTSKISSRSM